MKILIAADGSPYTKHMLAYLAAHDELFGPAHQYTVVNVVAGVPPRATAVLDRDLLKEYYADTAEAVFKPIRSFFKKQGLEASFVGKVGHAAEVIGKMAGEQKFDLVVMGSHGHTSIGNLVLGSVATKVLAACKTPVLLVR
ncbi:MAG: universal stress protein [Rhizobacter sp.]|nr:universal stress protein [Rhizobacter sp.]